jgi:hypothetical protein
VVLTFDDGPWPPTTPRVLAALAQECVRATFFLIGKPASEHPELVRRIAAEGHTVGHHTWLHRSLMRIRQARPRGNRPGIAAVKWRFTVSRPRPRARRSFAFPAFETTPATLDLLQSRGIVVFGADLWASDWNPMTPAQQLKLLTDRLKSPARESSCCTIPRRKPRPCCRLSCAICGTITIAWSIWCRRRRDRSPLVTVPPEIIHVWIWAIKAAFMAACNFQGLKSGMRCRRCCMAGMMCWLAFGQRQWPPCYVWGCWPAWPRKPLSPPIVRAIPTRSAPRAPWWSIPGASPHRHHAICRNAAAQGSRGGADLRRRSAADNSNQVLDILASQCVKATFFIIGRMAQANPEGVRKVRDAGHSIGTHTQNHPLGMNRMPIDAPRQEIDDGIASVTAAALGDGAALRAVLPHSRPVARRGRRGLSRVAGHPDLERRFSGRRLAAYFVFAGL